MLVIRLCEEALSRGDIPLVYIFSNKGMELKLEKKGIPFHKLENLDSYNSSKTLLKFCRYFRAQLKKDKIDILHSHLVGAGTAAAVATSFSKTKHVTTLHDVYTLRDSNLAINLLALASFCGTKIVTVANFIESYLRKSTILPVSNIQTIHNGTDLPKSVDEAQAKILQTELGFSDSDFIVVSVGRLVKLKGHHITIDAWKGLQDLPTLKLLVVGDGAESSKLKQLVSQNGLESQVVFAGFRDSISPILSMSKLFVLSSETEGLSCSITEAMMHELPIVASNVGGNSELVRQEKEGLLVPYNSSKELGAAIRRLFLDEEMRKDMARTAKKTALKSFSLDSMSKAYWDLYEK